MTRPTLRPLLLAFAVLDLAIRCAHAGGPDPGARRRVLGQCGNGQACVGEAGDVFGSCDDLEDVTGLAGDNDCECTDGECSIASTGAFTGELSITINENCPGGAPGGRVTMRLAGETAAGVPFDAATPQALDFCDVDIAFACNSNNHSSPFFCSNDFVAELGNRLTEQMLPAPEWLVLHPLPASVAGVVRAALGATDGAPVIVQADACSPIEGTPQAGDGLPVSRRYCVKGHLIHPAVPISDCEPGQQSSCIARNPLPPAGGTVRGATIGADPVGRFQGCCGNPTAFPDPACTNQRTIGSETPEVLFDWTPSRSGRAVLSTVNFVTNYDAVLYLRSGRCIDQDPGDATNLACDDGDSSGGEFPFCTNTFGAAFLERSVTAGQNYCIVVDGDGTAGNFELSVSFCPNDDVPCSAPLAGCVPGARAVTIVTPFTPAVVPPAPPCTSSCCHELCGDGTRDPAEECDDGNATAGDGCDAACHRESSFACGMTSCGEPSCLVGDDGPTCCGGDGSCVEPDGTQCEGDDEDACCETPAGRTCCRDGSEGTIVCTGPGDAVCTSGILGGSCTAEPDQCSECEYGAERECGLGRMTCFKTTSRSGRYCAVGSPTPGAACATEEACGGVTGSTARCTTVGFTSSSQSLDTIFTTSDDYTATGSARLCVPATERVPGHLTEPSIDPVTALSSLKVRPSAFASGALRLRLTDEYFPDGVVVDLRQPDTALVPASLSAQGPPAVPATSSHRLDRYVCYRATMAQKFCAQDPDGGSPALCNRDHDCGDTPCIKRQAFPSTRAVALGDRFGTRAYLPKKLVRVCLAAAEDEDRIHDDRLGLACYQVKPGKALCTSNPSLCAAHARQSLFATSASAAQSLTTIKVDELCVPTRINRFGYLP
jgi:cysteine-rich repeat protein